MGRTRRQHRGLNRRWWRRGRQRRGLHCGLVGRWRRRGRPLHRGLDGRWRRRGRQLHRGLDARIMRTDGSQLGLNCVACVTKRVERRIQLGFHTSVGVRMLSSRPTANETSVINRGCARSASALYAYGPLQRRRSRKAIRNCGCSELRIGRRGPLTMCLRPSAPTSVSSGRAD